MARISTNFYRGNPAWTLEELANGVKAPIEAVAFVLTLLEGDGFVVKTDSDEPSFIPGKPLDTTPVTELLHAIRESDEKDYIGPDDFQNITEVEKLVQDIDSSVTSALEGRMIKDLVSMDTADHHSVKPVPIEAAR
jgi:hypothetical protein|tara:strand:+ start:4340 stop:4747 length:408 start_codon:yes stop_codon:yes gene_type:complete